MKKLLPKKYTCYDCGVVLDNTKTLHVALRSGGHSQHGDGDLVGVLVKAEHHRVGGVGGEVGDCVRVHLVINLVV